VHTQCRASQLRSSAFRSRPLRSAGSPVDERPHRSTDHVTRAADPFATQIRTLDALHLASALLIRARFPAMRFATHDADLAAAALAEGLSLMGA